MELPKNKTKIVATIGPASETPEMLERLIRAGLNVPRLNFSHGDLGDHADRIKRIRSAAEATGRRVAIMADLPGPKIRIGKIELEPIQLDAGEKFALTTEEIAGHSATRVGELQTSAESRKAREPTFPKRRSRAVDRRACLRKRSPLQGVGRR